VAMAPRAMWTGQLRLSLVSFGVRLYAATESSKKVSMNQLHKDCNQRVRNQLVCPTHGPISRDDIVKGYEYEKDSYVLIEPSDLEAIRLESTKTIELVQFVDEGEIDALYINAPYFLGPDGPLAQEAFNVIHAAMSSAGKVGIGKVVMHGRESIVAIRGLGKGFLLSTLRYASEVRSAETCFSDIKETAIEDEQIELARSIMEKKTAPFDATAFQDQYKEAFFEVVKQKVEGQAPVIVNEEEAPSTFNFMEALRESVAEVERAEEEKKGKRVSKKPAAKSVSKKKSSRRANTA
jgi:DNA end-binding protein Ku